MWSVGNTQQNGEPIFSFSPTTIPVGFGQEFLTKEQCENTEESLVKDIPFCLKYNIKMK